MDIDQKLAIARERHAAFRKAQVEYLLRGGPDPRTDFERYGYRHGWFYVDGECFSIEQITGQQYDHTRGWAHL